MKKLGLAGGGPARVARTGPQVPPGTGATAERGGGRFVVARPVVLLVLIGTVVVVIVGFATATAARRVGQQQAIAEVRNTTIVKAQGLVEPVITAGLALGQPQAVKAVDDVVRKSVLDSSLVRVKIWRPDGRIVYSDEPRLIGATYRLSPDDVAALRDGSIEAEVSDLSKPENRFERQYGTLLEVYLPIRAPEGRLLFEAYYRYDAVSAAGERIWASFAPVALGGLVALEILQIPLAWSLARRLRQRQRERESLLRRTLEASDVERRRIASDLHDGVVQDLAGVAFSLAAAGRGLAGDPSRQVVVEAADALRGSITALRSSLVEIYPPDLAEAGLGAALENMAQDFSDGPLSVGVDVGELSRPLPSPISALLYRAAREALRNVEKHAGARSVSVRAGQRDGVGWVSVADDGHGFDPAILDGRAASGHMGLRSLDGLVRDSGGRMTVDSRRGSGTTLRVEVPTA